MDVGGVDVGVPHQAKAVCTAGAHNESRHRHTSESVVRKMEALLEAALLRPPHDGEVLDSVEDVHHEEGEQRREEAPSQHGREGGGGVERHLLGGRWVSSCRQLALFPDVERSRGQHESDHHNREGTGDRLGMCRDGSQRSGADQFELTEVLHMLEEVDAAEDGADVDHQVVEVVDPASCVDIVSGSGFVDAAEAEGLEAGVVDIPPHRQHRHEDGHPGGEELHTEQQHGHQSEPERKLSEHSEVGIAAEERDHEMSVDEAGQEGGEHEGGQRRQKRDLQCPSPSPGRPDEHPEGQSDDRCVDEPHPVKGGACDVGPVDGRSTGGGVLGRRRGAHLATVGLVAGGSVHHPHPGRGLRASGASIRAGSWGRSVWWARSLQPEDDAVSVALGPAEGLGGSG